MLTIQHNAATTIQSMWRKYYSVKHNIFIKYRSLQPQFTSVIKGYHMINTTPIKESVWEEINCDIVRDRCIIADQANGNHTSGKDNRFDNINISNKSTKQNGDTINISSYRLSSVCSDKNNGSSQDILNEIEKRDKSFDYYSILIRDEKENSNIIYKWYIIPKDCHLFKIDSLTPKLGKIGKKKDKVVGWKSKYCSITFSMSSQLWFHFNIEDIQKYKICQTEVDNSKTKLNYSQIYHSFVNTI